MKQEKFQRICQILAFLICTGPFCVAQRADNFTNIIKTHAIRIDPKILLQHNADIKQLEKSIHLGNYKVLAIGEQSHGTSEFFKIRTSLIKMQADGQQLTKIGLEAPMAEVDLLNQFIAGAGGNLKEILRSFRLYSYECSEFADLVETVKTINLNKSEKIKFFGFDAQSPFQALKNMFDYNLKNKIGSEDSLKKLINNYTLLNNELYAHAINKETFDELNTLSQHIISWYETQPETFQKSRLLKKSINNYKQFLMINNPYITNHEIAVQSVIRDSIMAINVLSEITDQDKIIILAHNAHVQKTSNVYSKSLGYFMSEKLGAHYKCIGSSTSTGFYTAFSPTAGKITDKNKIQPGDPDTFEFYFSKIEKPVFFLNTADVPRQLKNVPTPTKYRLLPYGYTENQFSPGNMLLDFDFVLHIEQTTGNNSFYLK